MKEKKANGFTLIEIIVSIAIASVVLMLIGTIILTSSGLLTSSSQSDLDKRVGDSVVDFVRGEIQYASDVRLVKPDSSYAPTDDDKKDNDWHSIYVKNGRLYRDDKEVFNDGFYNHNNLEITCQGNYENSQRLDIKYILNDIKETRYSTRDTVILLNFSASDDIKKNGLYTSEYKSLSQESGKDGYVIYYNKKYNKPSNGGNKPSDSSGTVYDELKCKTDSNTVYPSGGDKIPIGSFVHEDGHWYRAVKIVGNASGAATNKDGFWKLMEPYWSSTSSYLKGDVIIYPKDSNNYYRCKRTYYHSSKDIAPNPESDKTYWEKLTTEQVEQIKGEHSSPVFCGSKLCSSSKLKTVEDELCERDTTVSKPRLSSGTGTTYTNNKGDWASNSVLTDMTARLYYKGDFVEYNGAIWRCVYVYADLVQKPGITGQVIWKKIQEDYDSTSSYELGDVVKYNNFYYRSLRDSNVFIPIIYGEWEKVQVNDAGDAWEKV